MIAPAVQDVADFNREIIAAHGGRFEGPHNFSNQHSLEWALEFIQRPSFFPDPYPTIPQKAALVAWVIITGHVFTDGNKRTGMLSAAAILEDNGYEFSATQEEIVRVALAAADHSNSGMTLETLTEWFTQHSNKL